MSLLVVIAALLSLVLLVRHPIIINHIEQHKRGRRRARLSDASESNQSDASTVVKSITMRMSTSSDEADRYEDDDHVYAGIKSTWQAEAEVLVPVDEDRYEDGVHASLGRVVRGAGCWAFVGCFVYAVTVRVCLGILYVCAHYLRVYTCE